MLCVISIYTQSIYTFIGPQYFIFTIFVFLSLGLKVWYSCSLHTNTFDLIVLILTSYVVIHSMLCDVGVDQILKQIGLLAQYSLVRILCSRQSNMIYMLLPIALIGCIEAVIAIFQFILDKNPVDATLSNSARLGGYLSIIMPVLFIWIKSKNKYTSYSVLAVFLIMGIAVLMTGNRAALLGIVVGGFYYFQKQYSFTINKRLVIFFMLLFITLLILLKPTSVIGRIFIWKIILMNFSKTFLLGIGVGNFIDIYNHTQSSYFRSNSDNFIFEREVADFIAYPYNELFSALISVGLLPTIILLILMKRLTVRDSTEQADLLALRSSIITLIVYSMFSYPSEVLSIMIIVIIIIGVLVSSQERNTYVLYLTVIQKIIVCVVLAALIIFQISSMVIFSKINSEITSTSQCNNEYVDKYISRFFDAPILLYRYATRLYADGDVIKSHQFIDMAIELMPDPKFMILKSHILLDKEDYINAEEMLIQAMNMVPAKFEAKYWLFKLYEKVDETKAYEMAMIIVNQEVKIPSYYIENIKDEAMLFINSLNSKKL